MLEREENHVSIGLRQNGWTTLTSSASNSAERVALSLGRLIPSQRTGLPYVDLVPHRTEDAAAGTMSSLVGKGAQPLHTDGAHTPAPPHYLIFECLDPGEKRCPTHIWAMNLRAIIADRDPLLMLPQWVFGDRQRCFYGAIVQKTLSAARVRFDPLCMAPASFSSPSIREAQSLLKLYSQEYLIDWEKGSILIIDNFRCLHARGLGSENAPSRRLRRWQVGDTNGMG